MEKFILAVISSASEDMVVRATKYVSPKLVIRATRRRYRKKILKNHNVEFTLTIGKPNYLERKFIKECQKAGQSFPVRGVMIKLQSLGKKE